MLTQLDLFENKFDRLPDDIGDLSSLTDLLISKNQLESLPDSIGTYLLAELLTFCMFEPLFP